MALTVNLGQPGEDYDVVKGKALQLGAIEAHVVDAREEFAREYVLPAIKANAELRRRLPALHRARPAADRQARGRVRAQDRLRHDRPRLHRQGQRPGADRGHGRDARARAQGDRAGALVADGPRRGDRLRAQARDPGQGRHRVGAVLDRRQPLGPLVRGQVDRGPLARAGRRRLPARHAARAGARRAAGRRDRVRARACRSALDGERLALAELVERVAEIGCRHGVGIVDHIEDRIVGLKVRDIYEVPAAAILLPAHRELERLVGTIHQNQFKPRLDQQWAYLVYAGLWWEPLRNDIEAYIEHVNQRVTGTIGLKLYKGVARVVTARVAARGLRRAARDVRRVRRAVLPAGVAGLHRDLVAAVADGAACSRARGRVGWGHVYKLLGMLVWRAARPSCVARTARPTCPPRCSRARSC